MDSKINFVNHGSMLTLKSRDFNAILYHNFLSHCHSRKINGFWINVGFTQNDTIKRSGDIYYF